MSTHFTQTNSTRDYIASIQMMGTEIIPSDAFDIGENEYILLRIKKSTEGEFYLDILCLKGPDTGSRYLVPALEFENSSVTQLQEALSEYQSH